MARVTLSTRFTTSIVVAALAVPLLSGCGTKAPVDQDEAYKHAPAAMMLPPAPPHQKHNTETYGRITDNPFLAADRNPLSTFSADVSTASYSNVRRFLLTEGKLPPRDAVRIAEPINYFPYHYASPEGNDPVRFTVDLAECPWNAKHHLARIGVQARTLETAALPPRNFVFLVDTSGSMDQPNRLPWFKQAMGMLIDQLTERDHVAIAAYAGYAGLVLDSTPGSNKAAIRAAIDSLHADGSTNGGEGIVLAYRVAQQNFIKGGVNRVILGTDGDFNVGVTNEGDLTRLIDEKRASGVFLTILGFGMGNLKDATMEKLAYHGNGHYAYIDSLAEAHKLFVEQGGALVTVAKDVKLQVEFNPQRVGAYRLLGYENRLLLAENFNDDTKNAGAMGSGHTVTALYEIVPAGQPINLPNVDRLRYQKPAPAAGDNRNEWLTVKMRYKDPESDGSELLQAPLTGAAHPLAEMSADFRFAAAVAEYGLLLRQSEYKADANYAQVRDSARAARGDDPHGHRGEFLKLVDTAETLAGK